MLHDSVVVEVDGNGGIDILLPLDHTIVVGVLARTWKKMVAVLVAVVPDAYMDHSPKEVERK